MGKAILLCFILLPACQHWQETRKTSERYYRNACRKVQRQGGSCSRH